jgi:serine/threonine protein kinase
VLKITGYGLKAFDDDPKEKTDYKAAYNLLWTAPEILRVGVKNMPYGTQKGDVYSFAIVLQEILTREPPFFVGEISPKGQWVLLS